MKLQDIRIDYYTATPDFSPRKPHTYYWKKLKHFREGNIILIRDSKNGIDTIVRLTEDPRLIKPGERRSAGRWADQKFLCKYRVLHRDLKAHPEKKRFIPKWLRLQVLTRDKNTCQLCGQQFPEENLEVDHVKEFSQQGFTVSQNLLTLCKGCHKLKTNDFRRSSINVLVQMKNSPNVTSRAANGS